jgi:CRISPR-associated endonuclease Csn1
MKRLGLDLGSSSLGWAIKEDDKFIKQGVITFQSGMVKGQGGYSSPTKDRRESRSKRSLIKARKYRKWALLEILLNEFVPIDKTELVTWSKYKKGAVQKFPENQIFLKWLACDFTYEGGLKYNNPYELRVKALDNKLSKHEFGRTLYHLVQRRGYKDIGEADKETEKQIERRGESGFQKALDENRTIAEALTKEFLNKGERARNQYPYRNEYRDELEQICKGQGYEISINKKGEYVSEFVQSLWVAIIWQRPLKSQKGNIGKCTLESTKPRCPVSHPVFEIFRALCFINTIKYYDEKDKKQNIPEEFHRLLFNQVFLKKDKNFKFEDIRKFLDKQFGSKKRYNYPVNKKGEYDTSVSGMPVCKGLTSVFGENIKEVFASIERHNIGNAPKAIQGKYSIYDLWHILFEFDEGHLNEFAIKKLQIENEKNKKGEEFNPFSKIKNNILSGYSDLSLKAMCKIIPFLKEGYLYNEAVVLAKIPELLGEKWELQKEIIKECFRKTNDAYNWHKTIVGITNNLIDQYNGLEPREIFAYKDYQYILDKDDIKDVENSSLGFFGEKSWESRNDKDQVLASVKAAYQDFFQDLKRAYRETEPLIDIFKEQLKENNIEIIGELYHHSKRENQYGSTIKDKKTGIEILPEPRIDSIKNPMFNKAMSILRKLINELIQQEVIDEDTEVIIEIARELNDNNKRIAIEKYQNLKRDNREKYREFLKEFNENEKKSININDGISLFELWTEQTFEETENEKKEKVKNKPNSEILKEKEAVKRYELWMEQKGQCMYTGKMISITQLFSNEIDIAHSIPRSLLPDNTMANVTVCYARYNRDFQKTKTPFYCDNYSEDKPIGTAIYPRLEKWIELRDYWKERFEKNLKPFGNEDEPKKDKRIQEKHYCKMHFDYWHDKVERFTAKEVKDGWARRQLVDTQMISKYAREFLQTYFKKVAVQKGSVTADFRKIYSFQEEDEIKSRNKHTHHAIDASVLTLIPVNSSHRDKILNKMYETHEKEKRQYTTLPFPTFNSQKLIQHIDNSTLIVNYEKDKILKETYKNVRKRGKIQYLKDKKGNFVLDKDDKKILLKATGDTVRSALFAQTYLGKIRDVERHDDEQPKRENGDWKYKTGKVEYLFVKRENIDKIKASDKLIEAIVDPVIKRIVFDQKSKATVTDYQGKIIRHVRVKTNTGKEVKERVNYLSKHQYKNNFYSEAGSLPYSILLQKNLDGNVEREMIPIASFEIAKMSKKTDHFDITQYLRECYPNLLNYPDKKLLKVGQKLIVLNNDEEYLKRDDIDFQVNRLYVITQFSEGSIWLKYHLEAQSKDDIKSTISNLKDRLLREYEIPLGIPEVIENLTIQDSKGRKDDYENRKYRFDTINNSFRLQTISEKVGIERAKQIKNELDKLKAISGSFEIDGKTPLLKLSSKNWSFLYEGEDFEISLLGKITWVRD